MSEYNPLTFRLAGRGLRMYPGDYPARSITPHRHQWGMYDALTRGVSGAFANAAPTGSGKTESWVVPVVEEGLDTIAVYPTNALIEDQRRGITELLGDIDGGEDVALLDVTSETIGPNGKYAEQFPDANSNGERFSRLLKQHFGRGSRTTTTILLTNPDTFVLMRRGLYNSRVENVRRFEVAVVDEFHRANRKEQNTMLFLLDEMYDLGEDVCRLNQLVFLSATPDAELEAKFRDALSAPYYRVDEFAWRGADSESKALTDDAPRIDFEPGELPSDYRAVLPPVEITIYPAQTFKTAKEMLNDDSFMPQVQDGKCVIMLDGIHEVDQVYGGLLDAGVTGVARIDGFHRKNIAEKLEAPTLVSNSAVEVGVDFDTDQIMFSGHDAASFFQRLGRLRTRENESVARAYMPKYTFSPLESLRDAHRGEWLSRSRFEDELKHIYADTGVPVSFDQRYSAVEAFDHVIRREQNVTKDRKKELRRDGLHRISRHFFPEKTLTTEDIQRLHDAYESGVLDGLRMYRGESIQTLVFNKQEQNVQPYNIPYLLRHGMVSFVPREEFLDRIPESEHTNARRLEKYSAGYCIYDGPADRGSDGSDDAGRQVTYKATGQLYSMLSDHPRQSRKPAKVTGLEIEVDHPVRGMSHVKDALSEREVLCYALEGHDREIQNTYPLGPFGFIYPLLYSGGDAAVAFGHDALYLHCRVQDQAEKEVEDELDEVLDW